MARRHDWHRAICSYSVDSKWCHYWYYMTIIRVFTTWLSNNHEESTFCHGDGTGSNLDKVLLLCDVNTADPTFTWIHFTLIKHHKIIQVVAHYSVDDTYDTMGEVTGLYENARTVFYLWQNTVERSMSCGFHGTTCGRSRVTVTYAITQESH